jgi:hypothetical protein
VDFRVVVWPESPFYFRSSSEDEKQKRLPAICQEIARDIKRHVDGIEFAEVRFDTETTCSHCGSKWTEDGDYNGGCCDKDNEEDDARIAKATGEP